MKLFCCLSWSLLGTLLAIQNSAHADQFSVEFGTPDFQNTAWSRPFALSEFNIAFARLDSITWSASAGSEVSARFQNPTNFNEYVSLSGSSTLTISNPATHGPLATLALSPNAFKVLTPHTPLTTVTGFDTKTASGSITGAALLPFVGNGSLNFTMQSSAGTGTPGGNPVRTLASIGFTFHYTPIGLTQSDPILPTGVSNGVFSFNGVPSGRWFDPDMANAYEFKMTAPGETFTSILGFPTGFQGGFKVMDSNRVFLGDFITGQTFKFAGSGVTSFTIFDINPATDGGMKSFPLQLGFNTSTADFKMTPENLRAVPEPTSFCLLGAGSCTAFMFRRQALRRIISAANPVSAI